MKWLKNKIQKIKKVTNKLKMFLSVKEIIKLRLKLIKIHLLNHKMILKPLHTSIMTCIAITGYKATCSVNSSGKIYWSLLSIMMPIKHKANYKMMFLRSSYPPPHCLSHMTWQISSCYLSTRPRVRQL